MQPALTDWMPAPRRLPDGVAAIAIGDVHGCLDQLAALHEALRVELAAPRSPLAEAREVHVIHLGDYIDRGPDSAGVLARVAAALEPGYWDDARVVVHNLRGNHEQFLELALAGDAEVVPVWCWNGGVETLRSFDLGTEVPLHRLSESLAARLDDAHRRALASLENAARLGDVLFVHAGLDPGRPLAAQLAPDLSRLDEHPILWIRYVEGPFPENVLVVHGHTPRRAPEVTEHRINIDLHCYRSGRLGLVTMLGDRMRFTHVEGPAP
jgi:serine/threonine protein phosphatase 1